MLIEPINPKLVKQGAAVPGSTPLQKSGSASSQGHGYQGGSLPQEDTLIVEETVRSTLAGISLEREAQYPAGGIGVMGDNYPLNKQQREPDSDDDDEEEEGGVLANPTASGDSPTRSRITSGNSPDVEAVTAATLGEDGVSQAAREPVQRRVPRRTGVTEVSKIDIKSKKPKKVGGCVCV